MLTDNDSMPCPKNRVAIYVRVSTVSQIDKDSLPMQRQNLTDYAKCILDTEDCVVFEDAGYSGKNTDRPKFQEMMSQIRAGAFTHLLVWKIDRISRNLLDFALMYKELKELGVTFVSKNEQFDTSTAMGEAMLKIILVFAELERNMTSERVTATMINRATNGLWNGGRIPYGYRIDTTSNQFQICDAEASVVHLIHDKYEEFASLIQLSKYMNLNDYRTRAGNEWSVTTLLIILQSTFYCGDYQYNRLKEGNRQKPKKTSEWVTVENHHPAIIDREQKDRIVLTLKKQRRGSHSKDLRSPSGGIHLFQGILYCGHCGIPMGTFSARKKDWAYSYYVCNRVRNGRAKCSEKTASDAVIGEFVFNYILNVMNAKRNFDSIHSEGELQKQLLSGSAFRDVSGMGEDGLSDLYSVLSSGKVSPIAYRTNIAPSKAPDKSSERAVLQDRKKKIERALDRLMNLYLYSEDSLSEQQFISQKEKLDEALADINDQLNLLSSDSLDACVTDSAFLQSASEFILSQRLTGRNYVNFKQLSMTVDPELLRAFLLSILDHIIFQDGHIQTIVFKNGLSNSFIWS